MFLSRFYYFFFFYVRKSFSIFNFSREWKLKYDQVDDKEEDTIEFTLQNTFIFNKTLSNGLTGNEEIVVAHPLILVNKFFDKIFDQINF